MAKRPYQLRLYFPHPDGVSRPWLSPVTLGPFTTMSAAEDWAYEERIRVRRSVAHPDRQVVGYRIVNRVDGGAIEADVLFARKSERSEPVEKT